MKPWIAVVMFLALCMAAACCFFMRAQAAPAAALACLPLASLPGPAWDAPDYGPITVCAMKPERR